MDRFVWTSGLLEINETLVIQQRGVRIYDGEEKVGPPRAAGPGLALPALEVPGAARSGRGSPVRGSPRAARALESRLQSPAGAHCPSPFCRSPGTAGASSCVNSRWRCSLLTGQD